MKTATACPDLIETLGWTVYTFGVSTTGYTQGPYTPGYDTSRHAHFNRRLYGRRQVRHRERSRISRGSHSSR